MELNCFHVSVSYVVKLKDGTSIERSSSRIFAAKDALNALEQGMFFAQKHRDSFSFSLILQEEEGDQSAVLGCVKIHNYKICPINMESGVCGTCGGACIFEWKYDWGMSLEDRMNADINRFSKNNESIDFTKTIETVSE